MGSSWGGNGRVGLEEAHVLVDIRRGGGVLGGSRWWVCVKGGRRAGEYGRGGGEVVLTGYRVLGRVRGGTGAGYVGKEKGGVLGLRGRLDWVKGKPTGE